MTDASDAETELTQSILLRLPTLLRELLLVGVSTPGVSPTERDTITRLQPGHVKLTLQFFQNVERSPDGVSSIRRVVRETIGVIRGLIDGYCLIGYAHEGGMLQSMKPPSFRLAPPSRSIGNAYEKEQSDEEKKEVSDNIVLVGRAAGKLLNSVGIDWAYSPVVDVSTDPKYHFRPVGRSFGDTVQVVAPVSCLFIQGMQQEGVIACAKHYPGMGATAADSHVARPSMNLSLEELSRDHIEVYRHVIQKADVKSIMTNHAVYPLVEAQDALPHPCATLSRRLMTEILREEGEYGLNYDGVVVTDDLGMAGVLLEPLPESEAEEEGETRRLGPVEVAVRSILAGCDVLMWNYHCQRGPLAYLGILRAFGLDDEQAAGCQVLSEAKETDLLEYSISEDVKSTLLLRIQESFDRVQRLKEWRRTNVVEDEDVDEPLAEVYGKFEFAFDDPLLRARYMKSVPKNVDAEFSAQPETKGRCLLQ